MAKKEPPLVRHLLNMETLSRDGIIELIDRANFYLQECINKNGIMEVLTGRLITILFFEPSTRTRNSFKLAAKRLNALVLDPHMGVSATIKGESLIDTVQSFEAMGTELFIVRHEDNNIAQFIASELRGPTSVINGGDGDNQHPTQALLDLMTIKQLKSHFNSLSVAIIGDIAHSRVARSLTDGFKLMGVPDIRFIAPAAFMPKNVNEWGVHVSHSLEDGLKGVDVIVALRIQKERMQQAALPDIKKFTNTYGLTPQSLPYAKKDAIVLHPGPINRDIEIDSAVADCDQSVILQQVKNGVAMRMAILDILLNSPKR